MEKLSKALSEVDRKVEGLKGKFERTTMEAAKLKLELEKAQETIDAAENLVGKLEGEYRRWSGQVGGLLTDNIGGYLLPNGSMINSCLVTMLTSFIK